MNINAQEVLLMNKNMKFGNMRLQESATTVTEPPVTKPEAGLNILNAQAQNNIAFQAAKVRVPAKLKSLAAALMLGTAALGTAGLTSCVQQSVYVAVDTESFLQAMQQQTELLQKIYEELGVSNDLQRAGNTIAQNSQKILQNMYETQQLSLEQTQEFQTTVVKGIGDIISELQANGKTDKEILGVVQNIELQVNSILAQLASGQISFDEAMKELTKVLNDIDATLKDILAEVKGIRDDMNANHEEYMESKEDELDLLSRIYRNGKINNSYLKKLNNKVDVANETLVGLKTNSDALLVIANDPTKFNELMAKLDELDLKDEDYQKFEQMFKLLNMNIQDAINTAKEDNKKGQMAMIAAIKEFQGVYMATEFAQSKQMNEINKKLSFIANYLPNIDQSVVIDALEELTEALNNNTGAIEENTQVIGDGLENINGKLDTIIEKLDNVIENTNGLPEYMAEQSEYWEKALDALGKANGTLQQIKDEQKVTNAYLSQFKNDFATLKSGQTLTNNYLSILINKADNIEDAIKEIEVNGNGGMTRDEFLSAMRERDEERDAKLVAEFEEFIKEYGFDKVPGDVQTIKELIEEIQGYIANQKDYSDQLATIISYEKDILDFLENMDFSDPECLAKLDVIIRTMKNFEHNCNCKGDPDESVKDIEDLEKEFS